MGQKQTTRVRQVEGKREKNTDEGEKEDEKVGCGDEEEAIRLGDGTKYYEEMSSVETKEKKNKHVEERKKGLTKAPNIVESSQFWTT